MFLISFSRKLTVIILEFQVSWRHQMPKHEARNTFYWITLEVNTVCLCRITKEKIVKKFHKTCDLETSSRPFCVCKELSATSVKKMKLLKEATYIRYVLAKLSKCVQISTQTSSDSFLQQILWKLKRTWK